MKLLGSQIQNGDVFTFRGDWFESRVIRWWTGQPVSHAGLAYWVGSRLFLLETMSGYGLRLLPLTEAVKHYGQVFLQKNLMNGSRCLDWALEQWGARYPNLWQLLRKTGRGLHCAELVAGALAAAGFTCPKPPKQTTPGDLWSFECLTFPEELSL